MTDMTPTAPSTGNPAVDYVTATNSPQVRMVRSLEAMVSQQDAIIGLLGSISKEMAAVSARSAMFSRGPSDARANTLAQAATTYRAGGSEGRSRGLPIASSALRTDDPSGEVRLARSRPPSAGGAIRPAHDEAEWPPQRGGMANADMRDESANASWRRYGLPETWEEGRSPQSLTRVRKSISQVIGENLQQWNPAAGDVQLPDGTYMDRSAYEAGIASSPDTPGWFSFDGTGPGEAGYTGFRLRSGMAMMASDVGTAMGRGQGLGAALQAARIPGLGAAAMTFGKVAGPIGLAVTAGQRAISFAEDQRAQNMQYQRALGGSNFEGFSQRLSRNIMGLSRMGRMGSREAGAIFDNALSAYGNNDEMRQRFVDASTDLYMGAGMSAAESNRLLSEAASAGETNLQGLVDAIKSLGDQAYQTGIAATQATDAFTSMYSSLVPTFGSNAVGYSEAFTSAQMEFNGAGNVGDVSVAGMTLSESALTMAASRMGMTASQAEAALAGGDAGASSAVLGQLAQTEEMVLSNMLIMPIANIGTLMRGFLGNRVPITDSGEVSLTYPELESLGTFLQAEGAFTGFNSEVESSLRSVGIQISSPAHYRRYMATYLVGLVYLGRGITQMGEVAARMEQDMQPMSLDLSASTLDPTTGRMPEGINGYNLRWDWQGEQAEAWRQPRMRNIAIAEGMVQQGIIEDTREIFDLKGYYNLDSGYNPAATYARWLNEQGDQAKGSSYIEKMLKEHDPRSLYIVQGYNESGEVVPIQVNMQELLANPEYRDQADKGVAQRLGSGLNLAGELFGQSAGTYSLPSDPNATDWQGQILDKNFDPGEFVEEEAAGGTEEGGNRITVEFLPAPQLSQIVQMHFNTSGVVSQDSVDNLTRGGQFRFGGGPR